MLIFCIIILLFSNNKRAKRQAINTTTIKMASKRSNWSLASCQCREYGCVCLCLGSFQRRPWRAEYQDLLTPAQKCSAYLDFSKQQKDNHRQRKLTALDRTRATTTETWIADGNSTWHASKYKVPKLHQRYCLKDGYLHDRETVIFTTAKRKIKKMVEQLFF